MENKEDLIKKQQTIDARARNIKGRQADAPQETLQVLHIVLLELPTNGIFHFQAARCEWNRDHSTGPQLGLKRMKMFILTAEPVKPTRGVQKNESPAHTDAMDMESSKKNNLSGLHLSL
ncbi:hypothetical protein Tco_0474560 [Tanacetum coccineum]